MDITSSWHGPASASDPDVVVVGAGIGGIYAIIKLRQLGFSVLGIEAAADVGGVWYHNAYPGARVDLESDTFCYFFDEELYKTWDWSERYAGQPEVLAYLNHVADRYDVRSAFRFETWVVSAEWQPGEHRYRVETDDGDVVRPRFLIMAAGQLSRPRSPNFLGLEDFEGAWYQTSRWPHEHVDLTGKRVGVIGTGSSGVQAITDIAKQAAHLTVFQRTPNFSAPAQNRAADPIRRDRMRGRFGELWDDLRQTFAGGFMPPPAGPAADFTVEEQHQLMEQRWAFGSQSMLGVFTDQSTDWTTNALVSDFVRDKIRQLVDDPKTREALIPTSYPLGTKRLILDTGYYEVYNQPNVDLIDVHQEPIERITPTGIQTLEGHVDLDVIVFALGFEAFTGGLDQANIRNENGVTPSQLWTRGPQTYLGLTTRQFPNLFMLTGPGSPSVLTNMMVGNVHHVDMVAGLLEHMRSNDLVRVEPSVQSQEAWTSHAADRAANLIRRQVNNYMVHINHDDDSRVFIPYTGGFQEYVRHCDNEIESGYQGFEFDSAAAADLAETAAGSALAGRQPAAATN